MDHDRRAFRSSNRGAGILAIVVAAALLGACRQAGDQGLTAVGAPTDPAALGVRRLVPRVIATYPHDPQAFTQGLLAIDGDRLLESTGLYGRSSLREVELDTGQTTRRRDLPPELFAEGLAVVGDRAYQLTWREQVALVHDMSDFSVADSVRYEGEGWGLCHDGSRLVMSDGTDRLTFRDADSFEVSGSVRVTLAGAPVDRLNELECVDGLVYANVWQTDEIVVIDPASGAVTAVVNASGLLTAEERASADVLNGIAVRPETGTFLITGKLWPKLFEVELVAASEATEAP